MSGSHVIIFFYRGGGGEREGRGLTPEGVCCVGNAGVVDGHGGLMVEGDRRVVTAGGRGMPCFR